MEHIVATTPEDDKMAAMMKPFHGNALPEWAHTLADSLGSEKAVIWIDVSDFIAYAQDGNTTVSGIQRVAANLIVNRNLSEFDVLPVIPEFNRQRFLAANPKCVEALVLALQSGTASQNEIKEHLRAIYCSRIELWPRRGDSFVMVGAFWIYHNHDLLIRLRNGGIRNVLFIHDLIQIKNPEYLSEVANRTFRRSLVDALAVCDGILTNSEFVRREVKDFLASRLDIALPVRAVQLPTELPPMEEEAKAPLKLAEIEGTEFVLCVATIEIRKNHLYLVKIWEQLAREAGIALPKLVFVGKWGWNIEQLREEIDRTGALRKWLRIYNNITDAELNYLYSRCLFTVYPSFAEGWGLPVGESLARGKPCVTSNTTSMPEVGGEFAKYIDPFNVHDGLRIMHNLISDRCSLAQWERYIREHFSPKTWVTFCAEFYDALRSDLSTPASAAISNYKFRPGVLYGLGDEELPLLDQSGKLMVTARMTRRKGWLACGEKLAFVAGSEAILELQTDLPANEKVHIYLNVNLAGRGSVVRLNAGGGVWPLTVQPGRLHLFKMEGVIDNDGVLRLRADCSGVPYVVDDEEDPVYFGLSMIAFVSAGDEVSRSAFLEALTLRYCSDVSAVHKAGGDPVSPLDAARFTVGFLASAALVNPLSVNYLWLELARIAARKRRWSIAEIFYTRYLRVSPRNSAAWKQYGHILKEQAKFREAYFAYSICRELNPADQEVLDHHRYVLSVIRQSR